VSADVLSDVLSAVRLTGALYFDFDLSSPWVAETPAAREIAATVMPGAQRVIEYHVIARGECWGHAVGQEPFRLREGDLFVLPQGDAHVLSSAIGGEQTMPVVTRLRADWHNVHLLCSDGLTKHVSDERIAERLANWTTARETAERLLQDALDGGGTDNITIILGRVKPRDP